MRLAISLALSLCATTAFAQVTMTGSVQSFSGQQLQLAPITRYNQACNGGAGGIVGQLGTVSPYLTTVCADPAPTPSSTPTIVTGNQSNAAGGTTGSLNLGVIGYNYIWNGTSWGQWTGAVSLTGALPAGTNAIGGVTSSPGARTLVSLDVSTVTTGGTAVTALTAGHRTAGGFLSNPIGATINLCINEQGTATGTTSSGATTCIQPGQSYTLAPTTGAVSVITSDSSHQFSGYGLN